MPLLISLIALVFSALTPLPALAMDPVSGIRMNANPLHIGPLICVAIFVIAYIFVLLKHDLRVHR